MGLGLLQPEQVVKTGHPKDLAQGQAQLRGHLPEAGQGQVAVEGLQPVQHLNQALGPALLRGDQCADARIGGQAPRPRPCQGPGGDWPAPGHLARPHLPQTSHTPGLAAPFRPQGQARRQQGGNGAWGPQPLGGLAAGAALAALRRLCARSITAKRHRLNAPSRSSALANDAYQYEPVEKFGESLTTARPWNVSALAGVEQLNGRAAMVGFSAALLGEWLSGKGIVGQLGLGLAWLLNPSW